MGDIFVEPCDAHVRQRISLFSGTSLLWMGWIMMEAWKPRTLLLLYAAGSSAFFLFYNSLRGVYSTESVPCFFMVIVMVVSFFSERECGALSPPLLRRRSSQEYRSHGFADSLFYLWLYIRNLQVHRSNIARKKSSLSAIVETVLRFPWAFYVRIPTP